MEVIVSLTPLLILVAVVIVFLILQYGGKKGDCDTGVAAPEGVKAPGGVKPGAHCHGAYAVADATSIPAMASRGKRFANLILDTILAEVFAFAVFFVIGLVGSDAMTKTMLEMNDTLLGILILFIYYSIFESIFGRSPAKFITRTRVVTATGEMPSVGRVMGRTLCRFIPLEPLSFLGKVPSGWHDRLSNTRVIDG